MSRKGENIYKRKDNRWEARYIKGYTAEGIIRYGYCYAATYREVKEKVTAAKAALMNNLTPEPVSIRRRFGLYCDEWLRLNRSRVKESTYVKYITNIENHIKPKLGGCFVQGLSSLIVEEFSHDLLYEKELSPKTVRDILMLLHAILKYTQKQVPNMPLVEVVYPKDIKKEMRVLSRDEQTRLVQYLLLDMDECKFGVLLALLTGLRIGEVCALRWRDVSLTDKLMCVSSTMQRLKNLDENAQQKTKIIISNPKSNTSARQIPLTDYTVKLCKVWEVRDPSAFVLTGETDRYIEPRTLQYRLERYTKDCDLSGVHFHVMRHTFATRCVEVGFEIKSLSEILGHTSPKFTLERYVHSSLELKRDNMSKLGAIGY
ncbi:MAG: site-specific integrase [Christensenellaceae bacterium]|nr:site-specific integrase [Christensenellaceae bacterium]